MVHLELTNEETEVLQDILKSTLSDLSYEISNTPTLEYREGLKTRRETIQKIADILEKS